MDQKHVCCDVLTRVSQDDLASLYLPIFFQFPPDRIIKIMYWELSAISDSNYIFLPRYFAFVGGATVAIGKQPKKKKKTKWKTSYLVKLTVLLFRLSNLHNELQYDS